MNVYVVTKIQGPKQSLVSTSDYYLITFKDVLTKKTYRTHAFVNLSCWQNVVEAGVGSCVENLTVLKQGLIDGRSQPILRRKIS